MELKKMCMRNSLIYKSSYLTTHKSNYFEIWKKKKKEFFKFSGFWHRTEIVQMAFKNPFSFCIAVTFSLITSFTQDVKLQEVFQKYSVSNYFYFQKNHFIIS